MKLIKTLLILLLFSVTTVNAQLFGGESEHVDAELVSEVESIQPGQPFWVALRMEMEPEWHTYWKNAGDAGMATTIDWDLPEGFSAGELKFPYLEKIVVEGVGSYGYEDVVFLLAKITPPKDLQPGKSIELKGKEDWLECKIECIPGSAELSLSLPVKQGVPGVDKKWSQKFSDTRFNLPIEKSEWEFSATKQDSQVVIQAVQPEWYEEELTNLQFFPLEGGIFDNVAKQKFVKNGNSYQVTAKFAKMQTKEPDSVKGVLVAEPGWRGAESEKAHRIDVPLTKNLAAAEGGAQEAGTSVLLAIVFAFLGGIILNLMPCVLPVLSIKILGFVQQTGNDRKKIATHGFVFTAGVLVSFLVLAGVLLLLRAGGQELGWGFQLQSPVFVIILSLFLFLFGLNLFGVFEIGTSLTAVDGKVAQKEGHFGGFLSGVTATVVATPCTAPFMGSALGFAFTQPAIVTLVIFTFLALGMAFPYLMLSLFPNWIKYLPKPGKWMETLKQFMGFLLVGTVIWLLWVLGIQAGSTTIVITLAILLFASIGAWVYSKWVGFNSKRNVKIIARTVSFVLIAGSLAFGMTAVDTSPPQSRNVSSSSNSKSELNWQKFSPEKVKELKASGKPFFIDFTAAWCLTCQVNEKVALTSSEVVQMFPEKDIVALKADWTSRDETITRALAEYGRNSVPVYVLYKGNGEKPEILPEVLTPKVVLNAIENI